MHCENIKDEQIPIATPMYKAKPEWNINVSKSTKHNRMLHNLSSLLQHTNGFKLFVYQCRPILFFLFIMLAHEIHFILSLCMGQFEVNSQHISHLVPSMLILHYGLAHEYGQCLRIHKSILILLTNCLDMLDLLHNIYNN